MSPEQARDIHIAARRLVQHEQAGDLHPIDFQRFRLALWGNPLDARTNNASLLRMARASAGVDHPVKA